MPASPDHRIGLRPGYRLQWEPAQDSHVLLYPEGMVRLNPSAAEILKRCDGSLTEAEIISNLQHAFPDVDLQADVIEFLSTAKANGWIHEDG
ncbi:MAG: pyrroloquinoline quinone biosynthesis peptide chaperone PqqD [Pseudomonadota bacterium]|nr:pyrroloquinoline quinone biosynthesis peptide chaperone PqqD [Pseudomonadota bacterium]